MYIEAPKELGVTLVATQEGHVTQDKQAFEFAVREDFEVNNFAQGAFSLCLYRHKTPWLSYFVHGDDCVGLEVEADVAWYRQQVSKRFIMKFRGYLGPAAHHKRGMRILNRVFTRTSSEAGRAEMITHEGDPRHVDLLFLRDYGLEDGKSRRSTMP